MSNMVKSIAALAGLALLPIDPASSQSGSSTITLNVNPGGTVKATVTAPPGANYDFLDWTDASGKVLATTPSYTFTPAGGINLTAHFSQTPTGAGLFTASNTPVQTNLRDGRPLEVGVKFTSSVAGQITALKFFRSPSDTGPDLLDLWTSTGTKLASASFTKMRASGWQTVPLPMPVTIAANTTYIASYHTNGVYAATKNFFIDAVSSGTLTAPSAASSGGNGVYSYGGTSTAGIFPTSTFNASNYFADVVFSSSEIQQPVTNYTVTASAAPSQGGSVSAGDSFASGSSATVVATPASGYSFVNWTESGAVVSSAASYSFTVAADRNLVANFTTNQPPPPPPSGGIIPADRLYAWSPGLMSKGGIPDHTTICATLSPGANIQAALDSCPVGQVVQLNAGTYTVNNYLLMHSGITLRGAGAGQTILKKTNGAPPRLSKLISGSDYIHAVPPDASPDAQPILILGPQRWTAANDKSSQNLTVDGTKDASSVTVANAAGFAAGQFVLLDEKSGASWKPTGVNYPDNGNASPATPVQVWAGDRVWWNMHLPHQQWIDDSGNANSAGPYDNTPGQLPGAMGWFSRFDRPTNEIKEIASVSGNSITFTSPLTISYRVSHQAQLTRYDNQNTPVVMAGVKNLSMFGGSDGGLQFKNCAYCWAKNVEVAQFVGHGIDIIGSFRTEIRDSYIHTASWPRPGGGGYLLALAWGSSETLIENNILIDANKQMVANSAGAGSVVGYNYGDDSWIDYNPGWVEVGLNASHMTGSHHVLFEGNYSDNFDSDYTHGNSIYITAFRNWFSGKRRDFADTAGGFGNVRTVGAMYGSQWLSFVGNVLGRNGQMVGWHYTVAAMSCDASGNNCTGNNSRWGDPDIWKLGFDRWEARPDPKVLNTVIRDGNYDFLTNSQKWHNTPSGFAMPDSLYLKAKPAFFGTNPWPWVNPANGSLATLPAKARFDNGTYFCNSGS
jgi:hypothetical protein